MELFPRYVDASVSVLETITTQQEVVEVSCAKICQNLGLTLSASSCSVHCAGGVPLGIESCCQDNGAGGAARPGAQIRRWVGATFPEGATIVMKAINTNERVALKKALMEGFLAQICHGKGLPLGKQLLFQDHLKLWKFRLSF